MCSDSLIPTQIHSVSFRSTRSHCDVLCLNQILAISQRFAQPHAVSPRPPRSTQSHSDLHMTHSESCNLTRICSASCSFTQTRSDSKKINQIHSDLLHILLLTFIQILSDLLRFAQFRSRFSLIPTDSFRFAQIHSDLLRLAQTNSN